MTPSELDETEIDLEIAARLFPSLEEAMRWAKHASPHAVQAWLLFLATQTLLNTNQLFRSLETMTTQDTQLTQAVEDLLSAFNDNTTAIEAEIAAIKQVGLDGNDPAITASVNSIENIVAQMKQSTATAQSAIAPAPASSGDTSGTSGTPSGSSSAASDDDGTGTTSTGGAAAGTSSTPGPETSAGGSSTDTSAAGGTGTSI